MIPLFFQLTLNENFSNKQYVYNLKLKTFFMSYEDSEGKLNYRFIIDKEV